MNYLRYCRAVVEEYGLEDAYSNSQQKWMIDSTAKYFNCDIKSILLKSIGFESEEGMKVMATNLLKDVNSIELSDYVAKLIWEGLSVYNVADCEYLRSIAASPTDFNEYQDFFIQLLNNKARYCVDDVELCVFCSDGLIYINNTVDVDSLLKSLLLVGVNSSLGLMVCSNWFRTNISSHTDYFTSSCDNNMVKELNSLMYSLDIKVVDISKHIFSVDKYLDCKHLPCQLDETFSVLITLESYNSSVKNVIIKTACLDKLYSSGRMQDIQYKIDEKSGQAIAVFSDKSLVQAYVNSL